MPIFKKRADAKGISSVLDGKSSSYVVRSRRASNPQTGDKISKGSTVTSTPSGKTLTGFTSTPKSSTISISRPSLNVTSRVEKADMADGTVQKRTTTPDHAKKYNESPLKVHTRIRAQDAGEETYKNPKTGNSELSGVLTSTIKSTPGTTTLKTENKTVPTYKSSNRLKVSPATKPLGNLSPRRVAYGGSSKGDHPANKSGIGFKKNVIILKKKIFNKP